VACAVHDNLTEKLLYTESVFILFVLFCLSAQFFYHLKLSKLKKLAVSVALTQFSHTSSSPSPPLMRCNLKVIQERKEPIVAFSRAWCEEVEQWQKA